MVIGERTAEEIKIMAGSAFPLEEEEVIEIRGRASLSVSPAA
jgi:rod shape-determining protein MreB